MKTETTFHYSNFPLRIAEEKKVVIETTPLRFAAPGDFKNRRFAFIDNKTVQDCINWDASWFANYE